MTRVCTTCTEELDDSVFGSFGGKPVGSCRKCRTERVRLNRRAKGTPEKKLSHLLNNSKFCTKCETYLSLDHFNNDRRGLAGKSTYCRNCTKKHYRASTEYMTDAHAVWRKKNKVHVRWYMSSRRKRVRAVTDGTVTVEVVAELYSRTECAYCKMYIAESERTIDHILAIARGGRHTASNLTMACKPCNCTKNATDVGVFMARRSGS